VYLSGVYLSGVDVGLDLSGVFFYRFVFIMGTAMALVFNSNHKRGRSVWRQLTVILTRSAKLFVLGLMVNSVGKGESGPCLYLEVSGLY